MKKLFILVLLGVVLTGCSNTPRRQDYQAFMDEEVESPFFKVPAVNQKDFADRTWILLAESKTKLWFYDPYTLTEDEEGVVAFDAFFSPREQNNLQLFNATIVGPYRQKIDCFGNHQWSETLYTKNLVPKDPNAVDIKPVNGSGWVKIKGRTAMAYVRTRVCGRKFIDDQNINYFLFQTNPISLVQARKEVIRDTAQKNTPSNNPLEAPPLASIEVPSEKTPVFYEVVNNEVAVIDVKNDVRQMRLSSYLMEKDFPKQADYLFTANCQSNTYSLLVQGASEKSGGVNVVKENIGAKESLGAVAFNRACDKHGAYMQLINRGAR
ncbi:hypothetical protein ICN19_03125 [Polynucleobacter sp. AP-Capit-er-40B-B4]|uniref:hypothetical protein n=1 Tax=Polynucleobacter sp. AP-Capit-er-40B-B4 TaxID=2576927 RepID=UPI001C0D0768|nr:hypothetical protein [Polynucleobacter sp. AP-Capit-er-40B-B4]MBU3581006.1 hypothetical protein [Polynucleobacter sp. AP-Capit-er-40B-B4]